MCGAWHVAAWTHGVWCVACGARGTWRHVDNGAWHVHMTTAVFHAAHKATSIDDSQSHYNTRRGRSFLPRARDGLLLGLLHLAVHGLLVRESCRDRSAAAAAYEKSGAPCRRAAPSGSYRAVPTVWCLGNGAARHRRAVWLAQGSDSTEEPKITQTTR
mgnify:CR=1 FL=1